MAPELILASGSPRRKMLLEQAGYSFEVEVSDVPEPEPAPGFPAEEYVATLAWRKARAVALRRDRGWVLGADTTCTVDGVFLNKPVDRDDAERMIRLQEGRDVPVVTGICLYQADRHQWLGAVEVSLCRFRALSDAERAAYLDSLAWEGKAGAYGLQDDDPVVSLVSGSWSNVVGLPLERFRTLWETVHAMNQRG